jgi:LacI family transcriptional regulator
MVRLGLRVPADLAIVGYDDIEFAEAAAVPLTSVSQPRHLLGRTAAELLLTEARSTGRANNTEARSTGRDDSTEARSTGRAHSTEAGTSHVHQQAVFRPELIVRASTRG